MSSAREEILARIGAATRDLPARAQTPTAPGPDLGPVAVPPPAPPGQDVLDLFCENVSDYRAQVHVVTDETLAATVAAVLAEHSVGSLVVPDGLDPSWLTGNQGSRADDAAPRVLWAGPSVDPTPAELDGIDAVLTASSVGIARTGTIVLTHGPGQGARKLTLVPDLHLCVVRADQVVDDVPEAVARLAGTVAAAPLTWVSGPSATSDIELDRVEGVHGPRTLVVLLLT
jgi:L-lactate dehydrogenase complex protein LldG